MTEVGWVSRRGLLQGTLGLVAAMAHVRSARADDSRRMPVLYLSHGSPRLAIDPVRSAELRAWGARLAKPRGIIVMTPHFATRRLELGNTGRGFGMYSMPDWLKRQLPPHLEYASPPSEALAVDVLARLAGIEIVTRAERRGFDHTTWMPLLFLYPPADVPVLEIAYPYRSERELFALGRRLSPLRDEGILFVASGQMTHNLASIDLAEGAAGDAPQWSREFDAWAAETLAAENVDALLDWRRKAPAAEIAHPDDGAHYRVLLFALGVAFGTGGATAPVHFPVTGFESTMSKRCVQMG